MDGKRNERGFRVFLDDVPQLYGPVSMNESSIAFMGAHVWIWQERSKMREGTATGEPAQAVHLNVEAAEKVRDALDVFIQEARAGKLVEPVEAAEEEEEDDDEKGDG